MSEPFISEIRVTGTDITPLGWAKCDGQLLPIAQNTALFSLLGTTYGGDGRTTFGLPDLQSRAPMHPGNGPGLSPRHLGEKGGTETVTLAASQVVNHSHTMRVVGALGDLTSPVGNSLAQSPTGRGGYALYDDDGNKGTMADGALAKAGGGLAHDNMQSFLAVNFQIALVGQYPSRS